MTWANEVIRQTLERCYWCGYRYASPVKGTALTFVNDILDAVGLDDPYDGSTWLERWFTGYHETKTGRYVYTTPKRERYQAAEAYIAEAGFTSEVALSPHTGDYEKALRYAS